MFRHKKNISKKMKDEIEEPIFVKDEDKQKEKEFVEDENDLKENSKKKDNKLLVQTKNLSEDKVHELLEKNLKWSQIIYEQNRKINNKLLWSAIASWLRLFLILVPLILAFIYILPLARNFFSEYGQMLGIFDPVSKTGVDVEAINGIFDNLPLESSQIEQIKNLFGK